MLPETQETTAPQEPPRKWRYWWVAIMALILVVSVFANRARLVARTGSRSEAFDKIFTADFSLRYYYFSLNLLSRIPGGLSEEQLRQMLIARQALPSALQAIRLVPASSRACRLAGFSYLLLGSPDEALKAFLKGAQVFRERKVPLEEEEAFWKAVCGKTPLTPERALRLAGIAEGLNLRWYGHIALIHLYRQAGLMDRARAEEATLDAQTTGPVLRMILLILALLFLGVAGLVIGIVLFVVRASNPPVPVPWVIRLSQLDLWESFLFWIFVLTLLEAVTGSFLAPDSLSPAMRLMASLLLYSFAGLLGVWLLTFRAARKGARLSDLGLSLRSSGKNLLWGIGGYLTALPLLAVAVILSAVLARFLFKGLPTPQNPAIPMMAQSEGLWMRLLAFGLVSVAAPLFEETFFRGVLYQAFRIRLGVTPAVLLSAACFALVHPQLPIGFLPIFVLGVVFACLYELSHSLIPSMIAHGLNNAVAFVFVVTIFSR